MHEQMHELNNKIGNRACLTKSSCSTRAEGNTTKGEEKREGEEGSGTYLKLAQLSFHLLLGTLHAGSHGLQA